MPVARRSSIATTGINVTNGSEFDATSVTFMQEGEDKTRSDWPSPFEDSSNQSSQRIDLSKERHRTTRRASLGGSQSAGTLRGNSFHGLSESPPAFRAREQRCAGRRRTSGGGTGVDTGATGMELPSTPRRTTSNVSHKASTAEEKGGDHQKIKRMSSKDKRNLTNVGRTSTSSRNLRSTSASKKPAKRCSSSNAEKQLPAEAPKRTTSSGVRQSKKESSKSINPKPAMGDTNERWVCECGHKMRMCMKFCGMCAAPKHWTCELCDFGENECQFNFCGGCASPKSAVRRGSDSSTELSTSDSTSSTQPESPHDSVLIIALEYEPV
jgi:hypothetical protein